MAEYSFNEIEMAWDLMEPMESALWVTTLALHAEELDGGLASANQALSKFRRLYGTHSGRPAPEEEVAESNIYLTCDEFAPWYIVEHRIRNRRDPRYKLPTPDQIGEAYKRYLLNRDSFY